MDVKAYQGKRFRFSVSFKNKGNGHINILVSNKKQQESFRVFRTSREWKKGIREGQIFPDIDSVNLEVFFTYGNQFMLDDALFEIEISAGKWEALPILNPGFEEWTKEGKLIGWGKRIYFFENFRVEAEAKDIQEGNYALKVSSIPPEIAEYHSIKAEISNFQFRPVENLTVESNFFTFQDVNGFIWLNSKKGLIRFDGMEQKIFSHTEEDSLSISSNSIRTIYEDKKGGIWLGSRADGLNYFDPSTELFHRYQEDPNDPQSIGANAISAIEEEKTGDFWISTPSVLNLLDQETGNFTRFEHDPDEPFSIPQQGPWSMIRDTSGKLWFVGFMNLKTFNKDRQHFEKIVYQGDPNFGLTSNAVMDHDGHFWVLGDKGNLLQFNPYQRKFTAKFRLEGNVAGGRRIVLDGRNRIWMKVRGKDGRRIACYDISTKQFTIFLGDKDLAPQLRIPFPMLMLDQEGAVWSTGASKKIYRLDPREGQFYGAADPIQLSRWNIKEDIDKVLEDARGWIWYTVKRKGVYRIDPKTGQRDSFPSLLGRGPLRNAGLYEMSDGNIWVGYSHVSNGPAIINPITRTIKSIDADGQFANTFLSVGDTARWVALSQAPVLRGALNIYHKNSGELEILPVQHVGKEDFYAANVIKSIHKDKNGVIWLGMSSGLLKRYFRANASKIF